MKKFVLAFLFVFTLSFVFWGESNGVFAATEGNLSEVEEAGMIEPFGLPDLTPVNGAYLKTKTWAAGGRVDIDTQYFFMNNRDALQYASKIESSLAEGAAWFAGSWITGVGPYISSLGFLSVAERSNLASNIRQHANLGHSVVMIAKHDNFYGFSIRGASVWDGRFGSVKPTDPTNESIVTSKIQY